MLVKTDCRLTNEIPDDSHYIGKRLAKWYLTVSLTLRIVIFM